MYTIEKNVPAPKERKSYPFKQMQVGDSFTFKAEDYANTATASHMYGRRTGTKFCISGTELRVWRIS